MTPSLFAVITALLVRGALFLGAYVSAGFDSFYILPIAVVQVLILIVGGFLLGWCSAGGASLARVGIFITGCTVALAALTARWQPMLPLATALSIYAIEILVPLAVAGIVTAVTRRRSPPLPNTP